MVSRFDAASNEGFTTSIDAGTHALATNQLCGNGENRARKVRHRMASTLSWRRFGTTMYFVCAVDWSVRKPSNTKP